MRLKVLLIKGAVFAAGIVLCSGSAISFAAKCAGTNINNLVSWEPTEISKGTTLAIMRATSVTVSDDPGAAHHLVSGECIGQFLTTPDGKTVASGSCARRDKDGDVLNEEWVATDGAGNKGNWKNVGGTGKFSITRNNGQFEFSPLQGRWARCDGWAVASSTTTGFSPHGHL